MNKICLIFFCVASLMACKPGIPDDVVKPDEMEKILFDIHVLDGYVSSIPTPDSAKKMASPIYKGIFKKYGIDSALHAKSMAYYYGRPDLLAKMYDHISEKIAKTRETQAKKLEKEQQVIAAKEANTKLAAEAKKTDSIKKLDRKTIIDTVKNQLKPLTKLPKVNN